MEVNFLNNINIWSPEIIFLLIVSGFIVGIINTLAGSGTIIGYAVFMTLGLPPSSANGTIRIGVLPQTFAAVVNFYKKKLLNLRNAISVAIPITIGSIIGAEFAIEINQNILKYIIVIAMLLVLLMIFIKPKKWLENNKKDFKYKFWHSIIYFVLGIYGGFIHIGVGLFLLVSLVLISGYDLVQANSLKVFIVFVYTPFALAVFMLNGEIHYAIGFISAIGNTLGGIFASKFAIKYGAKPLKWFLVIVIILFITYLLIYSKL